MLLKGKTVTFALKKEKFLKDLKHSESFAICIHAFAIYIMQSNLYLMLEFMRFFSFTTFINNIELTKSLLFLTNTVKNTIFLQ